MSNSSAGADSDLDFDRAKRAVERGWLTREQVELALQSFDRSRGTRLLAHLSLTPEQIRALEDTLPLPPEAAEALKDPRNRVGRYWNVKLLGSGGMGMVFRAWDPALHRWVALKILKKLDDETARAYFHREAQLAAALSHPNIAAIYEVGEDQGMPFIAMQLVDGENLHAARKRMTLPLIVKAIKDSAEGVDYAHRQGVVHRDLKPANLMIDKEGRVFVMDFGLAKQTSVEGLTAGLSGSNIVLGTPAYMSPEQARGNLKLVDRVSDVYSLGAALYEMVTGRPPFQAESQAEILIKVLQEEPARPRRIDPALPGDIETIALKCLEKEKERRYTSAKELADDLQRYLNNEPIVAHPPSMLYRFSKRIRKYRMASALAALLVLLSPVGGYFARRALLEARERARVEEERRQLAEIQQRTEAELKAQGSTLDTTKAALELWQSLTPVFSDAEIRSRAGDTIAARKRLQEGVEICERAIKEHDAPHVHYFLGRLYSRLGRASDSRRELEESLKLDPGLAPARVERGLLLLREYSRSLVGARLASFAVDMKRTPGTLNSSSSSGKGNSRDNTEQIEAVYPAIAQLRKKAEEDLSVSVQVTSYFREQDLHVALAELARLRKQYDEAARHLDQAAALDPRHEGALLGRSRLAQARGDLRGAADLAQQVVQQHRGNTEALRLLAELHRAIAGSSKDGKEKAAFLKLALEESDRAVALNDQEAGNWSSRSEAESDLMNLATDLPEKLKGFDLALADLNEAIRLEPRDTALASARSSLYQTRALTATEESDWEIWLEKYHAQVDDELRLNPDAFFALGMRAALYMILGIHLQEKFSVRDKLFQSALADLSRQVDRYPAASGPLFWRGCAHRNYADAQEAADVDPVPELQAAISDFTRSLQIEPDQGPPFRNRAEMECRLARRIPAREEELFRGALEDYDAALGKDPKNLEVLESCARLRREMAGKMKDRAKGCEAMTRAAADFSQAISLEPSKADLFCERAICLSFRAQCEIELGKDPRPSIKEGLKDLSQAILLDTSAARYWKFRALFREGLGSNEESLGGDPVPDYLEAVTDYTCAERLNPDDSEILKARSAVYMLLAQRERSRKWIELALEDRKQLARRLPTNFEPILLQAKCLEWLATLDPKEIPTARSRTLELYSRAIRRGIGGSQPLWSRANTYWTRGQSERAQGRDPTESYRLAYQDFAAYADTIPTPEAYTSLAQLAYEQAEWEILQGRDPIPVLRQAILRLDAALKAKPPACEVYAWRANLHEQIAIYLSGAAAEKELKLALKDADLSLQEKNPPAERYSLRAHIHFYLGMKCDGGAKEYRLAIEDSDRAIELSSSKAQSYRTRSRFRLWLRSTLESGTPESRLCVEQAVKDAARAVELEPSAPSYEHLGGALEQSATDGEKSAWRGALSAFEKALQLDPDNVGYRTKVAELKKKVK